MTNTKTKFPKKFLNQYTLGDALPILNQIPERTVDLFFTSIPDISQMSSDKDAEEKQYLKFMHKVIDQATAITKDDGFLVFSQQDRRLNGKIFSKHFHFIYEMDKLGYSLKDEKIIIKDGIKKGSSLFQFTYQYFSVFTRTGKIKRKGDYLRDVIVDPQLTYGGQKVWSIPFCSMVIKALTNKGDIVVDPFAGAAPVLYAAKKLGRNFWGAEIDKKRYNENFHFFRSSSGLFE